MRSRISPLPALGVLAALTIALALAASGPMGCAEQRPAPVPLLRPPPAEAQGFLGLLEKEGGAIRFDVVPLSEQDRKHTPIPSGYWPLLVLAENTGTHDLPLNPALDRWTVVDPQGFENPAYPATTLHLGAYLEVLPSSMRARVSYPGVLPAGSKVRFPLFIPNEVGAVVREVRFYCRSEQKAVLMRRPADTPVPVPAGAGATAEDVSGTVTLTLAGQKEALPLASGESLRPGDRIRMEAGGQAVVWDRAQKKVYSLAGPETFEITPPAP